MNKVMRILAIISSVVLIFWDFSSLSDIASASGGAEIFNIIMSTMLPCGMLFGITSLLYYFEKTAKKPLAVITAVFFGLMAVIRIFALILQLYFIADGTAAKDFNEILLIVEFIGYLLLAVSAVFLMVYIVKGAMRRTSLTLYFISAFVLLIDWIIIVYNNVTDMMFKDSGLTEILLKVFTGDFIWSLTTIIAYTVSFAFITKVLDDSLKVKVN